MKRKSIQWIVVAVLLSATGLAVFGYKVMALGYPLSHEGSESTWTVQARIKVDPTGGPVSVSLILPGPVPGFDRLQERFVSRGFGRAVETDGGRRVATWTIRRLYDPQTLYYRGVFFRQPAETGWDDVPRFPDPPELEEPFNSALQAIVADVRARSANIDSFTRRALEALIQNSDENVRLFTASARSPRSRADLAAKILTAARIPTLPAHGIRVANDQRIAELEHWIAVHDGGRWHYYNPATAERGLPEDLFIWWRGEGSAVALEGAELEDLSFSVRSTPIDALVLADERAERRHPVLASLSLSRLPVETQDVYGVLLLVPLGALIIVVLRNIVGVRTFGTFMPVLIALAFRDTGLVSGVILFTVLVSAGLLIRFYMEHLRLLLVPRLAAVLTIVVLLMVAASLLGEAIDVDVGLSVALFPMVILAMTIERMSVVWEERGAAEAIRDGLGSLAVAAAAFLAMDAQIVRHLAFVYPELQLVVLGLTVAMGRYTGYRISELGRFKKVVDFSGSNVDAR